MGRLTDLDDRLRRWGLEVSEVSGWKDRGSATFGPIRGMTCHATAGARGARDQDEINVLLKGSATAPPPIVQLYLSRSGRVYVVAAGRCNHNKTGWAGPNKGLGNTNLIGVEAGNDNRGEPWSKAQYDAYVRLAACLSTEYGFPVSKVAGHKEHQPYAGRPAGETSTKSDPVGIDMDRFRRDVAALVAGREDKMDAKDFDIQLPLAQWVADAFPNDEGIQNLLIKFRTAVTSGYGHSRMASTWGSRNNSLLSGLVAALVRVEAQLAEVAGRDPLDEQAIVDGVLAGLGGKPIEEAASALAAAFGDRAHQLAQAILALPTSTPGGQQG